MPLRSLCPLVLLTALVIGCAPPAAPPAPSPAAEALAPGYAERTPTRGGTGRTYFGREIAQVMSHRAAAWLERPERAAEEEPERLLAALALPPDAVVADIGAGTGFHTVRLARRLPQGAVYAVDVQAEMLALLEGRLAEEGLQNVVPVLGEPYDPMLPEASVDLALVVDAYHEFYYPREMLEALREALRPGGRLVLVEYRDEPDSPIHPLHRMTEAQARREVEASGFRWVETLDVLPMQHVLVFERP